MRTRIGTRLMLGAGLVTSLVIGVMAVLVMRSHTDQLTFELNQSANQVSETIKSSTHYDMLENRRDDLHRQIRNIGDLKQQGIQKVRLFNKEGQIMFSSDHDEIGTVLDEKGEACYACHAEGRPLEKLDIQKRSRIFRAPDGTRILGIINPIPNEASCWTADCHAHSQQQKVLGVLDVNLSMVQADRQIASSRRLLLSLAALAILASSLVLWWLNKRLVLRPVAALLDGTRRVAAGDLTTTISVTANHELGDLAKAFNAMTQRIAETQRQLTQADKLASVGRLAAGVAHEINNPLTGVLTYASLLAKRYEGDAETREDLDVIVRETKRCRGIIRELLDFARPTPPARKAIDLNEVVRRSMAVVMNQLSMNHVNLALDLAADLPEAFAEGNQIQQVVVNLLLNAADAIGPDGGQIHLLTRTAQLEPRGHSAIRRATCAKGHDLMDPSVPIGGLASIRVLVEVAGRELALNLDPVYDRYHDVGREAIAAGTLAHYACPVCRRSLHEPEQLCDVCGAPTFMILTGTGDPFYQCTRQGCHTSHWPSRDRAGAKQMVELRVEDTGSGITVEDLPHIFEPFFSNKGNRGTGLGLAVTWGIIEGHDGTIDVQSEVGKGTHFTVRLPLAPPRTPPPSAP
ncbi:MAG: ATP-binding protein [Holophaga sp.]|nr:ATP-binding protein [Holophaga sp.]